MAFLVVLIVDDVDKCRPILDDWEAAGAGGVTILESSGIGRVRRSQIRDDFPLLPSLRDMFRHDEYHHRTMLSVVKTEDDVRALVKAAESVLGDLDRPDTGFLFVVALHQVLGLNTPLPNLEDSL